jgi:antitoxin CcdA
MIRITLEADMSRKRKAAVARAATSSPRRPVNVSVDAGLLQRARALGVNFSQALEQRLVELLREADQQRWLAENAPAIADYNERVEREGVFSDGRRRF